MQALSLVSLILISTPVLAQSLEYPAEVQATIQKSILSDLRKSMAASVAEYNRTIKQPDSFALYAAKAGMKPKDRKWIQRNYPDAMMASIPQAVWKDDQVVLQGGGHTIMIGFKERIAEAMRVDGRVFAWNYTEPAAQNIKRYEAMFHAKKTAQRVWMSEAWAGDPTFYIQAAGIKLYFTVTQTGQTGTELEKFQEQVVARITQCEAAARSEETTPERQKNSEHITQKTEDFIKQITLATFKNHEQVMSVSNCDDLKGYGKAFKSAVPLDLCEQLDHLAECFRGIMKGKPVSKSAEQKKPADQSEWYEKTHPYKGTDSKSTK